MGNLFVMRVGIPVRGRTKDLIMTISWETRFKTDYVHINIATDVIIWLYLHLWSTFQFFPKEESFQF